MALLQTALNGLALDWTKQVSYLPHSLKHFEQPNGIVPASSAWGTELNPCSEQHTPTKVKTTINTLIFNDCLTFGKVTKMVKVTFLVTVVNLIHTDFCVGIIMSEIHLQIYNEVMAKMLKIQAGDL